MDELTAAGNRLQVWQRLQDEFARYLRNERSLSFLLLEIDHGKRMNDQYGHLAGDYLLKELCAFIPSILRTYDIVGRYDQEKIGVILPNINFSSSRIVAERIRSQVEKYSFIFQRQRLPVTISIGLADANPDVSDSEKLMSHANEALNQAKESGRNRVCSHEYAPAMKL